MADRKKVLIVEDESLTALMLEACVEDCGFLSAGLAATGEEAVELARRERPDLVLMDYRLAGKMSGMDAAKVIGAELKAPVVMMSGYSERIVLEGAGDFKPRAILAKPVDELTIADLLKTL